MILRRCFGKNPGRPPQGQRKWPKRLLKSGLALCAVIGGANAWVLWQTRGRCAGDVTAAAPAPVALVLGTGKFFQGQINWHFASRMDAAASLYHSGKVGHLLLSGDRSGPDYDEPADMREALLEKGVPASALTLDPAGFRTLDSFARARNLLGITKCVVITDDFHLPRSLYLAQHFGIDATGLAGKPVPWRNSFKSRCREVLARVLVLLDVHVLHTGPRETGHPMPFPG